MLNEQIERIGAITVPFDAPPYNQTHNPPNTLSFLGTCDVGQQPLHGVANLWPGVWAYDDAIDFECQAHVAFKVNILARREGVLAETFLKAMANGRVAFEAVGEMWQAYM